MSPSIQPVRKRACESRAATHEIFRSVEKAQTLLYAQENTNAQLRSHSCFPDRLVILNEDRVLSDDQKGGFRRKSKKFSNCQAFTFFKTLPGCRAYSQLQRFLMGTTVIRTMSVTGRKVTKQICYFKFSTSNAKHLKQSLGAIVDHLTSPDEVEESVVFL